MIVQNGKADATVVKANHFLAQLVPALGNRPLAQIEPYEVLAPLKRLEGKGKHETAKKTRSFASPVFRFGVATIPATHVAIWALDSQLPQRRSQIATSASPPLKNRHLSKTPPPRMEKRMMIEDWFLLSFSSSLSSSCGIGASSLPSKAPDVTRFKAVTASSA